jgi:hypothetical protein
MTALDHAHDHPQPTLLARHPILTGVAVGIGTLLPHAFLPTPASLAFAAVIIALVAGIYFGFAVVNGDDRQQLIEFSIASAFAVGGLLGLLYWLVLLALVYFAHGIWDLAHHNRAKLSLVAIPQWYVPWCVVIDVIVGAGLLAIWAQRGLL